MTNIKRIILYVVAAFCVIRPLFTAAVWGYDSIASFVGALIGAAVAAFICHTIADILKRLESVADDK